MGTLRNYFSHKVTIVIIPGPFLFQVVGTLGSYFSHKVTICIISVPFLFQVVGTLGTYFSHKVTIVIISGPFLFQVVGTLGTYFSHTVTNTTLTTLSMDGSGQEKACPSDFSDSFKRELDCFLRVLQGNFHHLRTKKKSITEMTASVQENKSKHYKRLAMNAFIFD